MNETSNIEIRDARSSDRDKAKEVTLAAYQQYSEIFPPAAWNGYKEDILETIANEGSPAKQIVAELDGEIVGTVLLFPAIPVAEGEEDAGTRRKWPEFRLLAVAPSARGKGVGVALVQECMRRTHDAGIATLQMHTLDVMSVAMRMYEKMGFVRMPEIDSFPIPTIHVKGYRYDFDH